MMKRILFFTSICFISFLLVIPSTYPQIITIKTYDISHQNPLENETILLEPGDIAFKHPDITPDWFPVIIDHCLLFIEFNYSTKTYVFIEASQVSQKVQYKNVTKESITGPFWGPFGKVKNANSTQKQNAIDFAKHQLGKDFQNKWINKNFNYLDNINDSYANTWYCSELIWAAYYNCNNSFAPKDENSSYIFGEGIDLDKNKWNKELGIICVVRPKDIARNEKEIDKYFLGESKPGKNPFFTQFFSPIFLHVILSLTTRLS